MATEKGRRIDWSKFPGKVANLTGLSAHVDAVVRLLPHYKAEIKKLVMSSELFRGLCEDYGLAIETLALLETRNLPQDAERVIEYRQLIAELAQEIREMFPRTYQR